YIVLWAINTISNNLHHWPFIAEAQARGAKVVVIDPVATRTAKRADWHIKIRPSTDAALALGMMNVIIAEGLVDRDYVDKYAVGDEELKERAAEFPPEKVAELTGVAAGDVRRFAREFATVQPSVIRMGVAIERHAGGGNTVRALSCLPALVGSWRRCGGGILHMPIWAFPVNWDAMSRPDWIRPGTPVLKQWRLGAAANREAPPRAPSQGLLRLQFQSDGGRAGAGQDRARAFARGSVHGRQRAVPDRHRAARRHRPAGDDPARAVRRHVLVGASLSHPERAGDRAAGRGGAQH